VPSVPSAPIAALRETDPELAELIFSLLALERAQRPQSASVVADRLRTWLAEHQPRGVLPALAERVGRVDAPDATAATQEAQAPRISSGRIEVRSIAVNPELSALLRQATERIERPSTSSALPAPDTTVDDSLSTDPEGQRVVKRFLRDIIVVSFALMFALVYARSRSDEMTEKLAEPVPSSAVAVPAQPVAAVQPEPAPAVEAAPAPALNPATEAAAAPTVTDAAGSNSKRGFLTVSATPWAEVRLDGRLLGTTPRRSVPLRAGKHVLNLSCPPLAHDARVSLDVTTGQELHVSANMHESPPAVSVH
jgi:hypothetical protein